MEHGNNRCHNECADEEVGRKDIKDGGRRLGSCQEEIVRAVADNDVCHVCYDGEDHEPDIRMQDGFLVRTHLVNEYQVENTDISDEVLRPELIESEAGGACKVENRRRKKREDRSAERPEIANVKEVLIFADDHKSAEDNEPSANSDRKIGLRACFKL